MPHGRALRPRAFSGVAPGFGYTRLDWVCAFDVPMIGRERELAAADEFLDALAEGAAATSVAVVFFRVALPKRRRGSRTLPSPIFFAHWSRKRFSVFLIRSAARLMRLLLRGDAPGSVVDQRAVSAAVASVLIACAAERPLVVAGCGGATSGYSVWSHAARGDALAAAERGLNWRSNDAYSRGFRVFQCASNTRLCGRPRVGVQSGTQPAYLIPPPRHLPRLTRPRVRRLTVGARPRRSPPAPAGPPRQAQTGRRDGGAQPHKQAKPVDELRC